MVNRICKICNKKFNVSNYRKNIAKCCSRKCLYIWRKGKSWSDSRIKMFCKICNKEFYIYPSRLKRSSKVNFCSNECAHIGAKEYMKGKNIVKKIKKNCQICRKEFSILPCRIHIIKHCSKKCLRKFRKQQFSKEKNHNWKGGITPLNEKIRKSIEYRLWREAVYARDNWTCQKCYERGKKINAHHIKKFSTYPELRFAINNGITLCEKCHNQIRKEK